MELEHHLEDARGFSVRYNVGNMRFPKRSDILFDDRSRLVLALMCIKRP